MRAGVGFVRVLVAASALWVRAAEAPAEPRPAMVLTQLPASRSAKALANGTLRDPEGEGGRIVWVAASGRVTVLTPEFHSAADPAVSFDGRRILFAAKRGPADPWCLYEREIDGPGERAVVCPPGGARHPLYLPAVYTLTATSTEAHELVAFVGETPGVVNEAGRGRNTSLYSCRLDGSGVERLTFNLSNDFDPTVLEDGRIVYASWQRHSLARGPNGRVVLLGLNLDGTDALVFAADEGRRVKHMATPAADRQVVFVEADAVAGDGSGTLAAVSLRRNLHSYRPLSAPADGLFHSPSADPRGGLRVSWRPEDGRGTYGVYHFDLATGRKRRLYDDPDWHDVQARVVAPHPRPDGRSSVVSEDDRTGTLYGLDVGITDLGPSALPTGTAKRLRVIEGLARAETPASTEPLAPRRVLGEVPLAGDGSFHLQVPADTALQLQLLDADGLALRSSAWIWARPRESRGCIGCHEDPERTPPNRFVKALQRPADVLTAPASERRCVDFRHDVAPLLEARCLSCHADGGAPPALAHGDGARAAYDVLLAGYVEPGQARTSPLAWHLLGRDTRRPWDATGGRVKSIPEGRAPSADEIRTFIEWIDLGAAWDSGPTRDGAAGASR